MKIKRFALCLTAATLVSAGSTVVQAEDTMYMPSLSYRTGAFAGGGTPFADGYADYFNMLNERDGGINGVKIVVDECETAYNTQKGVECYEATKGPAIHWYHLSTNTQSSCGSDPRVFYGLWFVGRCYWRDISVDVCLSDNLLESTFLYLDVHQR